MSRIEKLLKAIINNTTYDELRLSRIEEIFYSILYSLPYNADAQSRIEALLLALKESGLYDERTLSRIEEILKCKLDGSTYTGWIGSRVEMLLNEWELSEIIEATFTSFPIIIKANGEPLLDYTTYGNTVQNGTPTPENPIQPSECGERTGNLAPYLTEWVDGYVSGSSGAIAPPSDVYKEKASDYIEILPNTQYTFSYDSTNGNFPGAPDAWRGVAWYTASKQFISRPSQTKDTPLSLLSPENAQYCRLSFRTHGNTNNTMLNTGSTALPYEPYGIKIPISSANTTTPVYLGEVETTRKIKKLVLTGEEEYKKNYIHDSTSYLYYASRSIFPGSIGISPVICNELPVRATAPIEVIGINTTSPFPSVYFNFGADIMNAQPSGNTAAGLKEYLAAQYAAGTPVTVWYVLANEETGIVNEPLRKIGDYADTLSMEQAGVDIPTNNGNTVIDVDTALKPSEMYIKYNGEGTHVYITADDKLYITSNNEIYVLKR